MLNPGIITIMSGFDRDCSADDVTHPMRDDQLMTIWGEEESKSVIMSGFVGPVSCWKSFRGKSCFNGDSFRRSSSSQKVVVVGKHRTLRASLEKTTENSASRNRNSNLWIIVEARANLAELEKKVEKVRCPFFRRRFTDAIESAYTVLRWIGARHKRLAWNSPDFIEDTSTKQTGMDINQLMEIIRDDFVTRRYYITGQLTRSIYTDNCLFDGPDPDVPVRGLRKYVDATSHLFDRRQSRVDLLSISVQENNTIHAEWRLEAVLLLPWKPRVKAYTGTTTYTFNSDMLIESHIETWSISVVDAFVSTLLGIDFGARPADPAEILIQQRNESHSNSEHKDTPSNAPIKY
mmetsp:Transcript_5029/g.8756  ORF Transcript_5029/g.8756 Transcript_5029/m.8756 type:complete len:348 (+) Transcript_5029:3038-4081(+)